MDGRERSEAEKELEEQDRWTRKKRSRKRAGDAGNKIK
jgi:hypothetical protein